MDDLVQPPVEQSIFQIQQKPQAPQTSPKSQKPFLVVLALIMIVVILGIVFYLIKGTDTSQVVIQTDKSKESVSPNASIPTSTPVDQSVEKIKNEAILGDKSLVIEKKSYHIRRAKRSKLFLNLQENYLSIRRLEFLNSKMINGMIWAHGILIAVSR